MKDIHDKLDNIFDSDDEDTSQEVEVEVVKNEKSESSIKKLKNKTDIDTDYEYARANLYSIIEKGQEALNGALELAQDEDSARAYEVVGQLIKSVSDTTDKIMDLQKKLKDLDTEKTKGPTNVTNAMFIGSTTELMKQLKQLKNSKNK